MYNLIKFVIKVPSYTEKAFDRVDENDLHCVYKWCAMISARIKLVYTHETLYVMAALEYYSKLPMYQMRTILIISAFYFDFRKAFCVYLRGKPAKEGH